MKKKYYVLSFIFLIFLSSTYRTVRGNDLYEYYGYHNLDINEYHNSNNEFEEQIIKKERILFGVLTLDENTLLHPIYKPVQKDYSHLFIGRWRQLGRYFLNDDGNIVRDHFYGLDRTNIGHVILNESGAFGDPKNFGNCEESCWGWFVDNKCFNSKWEIKNNYLIFCWYQSECHRYTFEFYDDKLILNEPPVFGLSIILLEY